MITKTLGPPTPLVMFGKILLLKTESYRAVKKKERKNLYHFDKNKSILILVA